MSYSFRNRQPIVSYGQPLGGIADTFINGVKKILGQPIYDMDTQCSTIPAGDPYRKPPNYCTQPSGNVMMFNADGTIDPDPFPVGTPPAQLPPKPGAPGGPPAPPAPSSSWTMPVLVVGGVLVAVILTRKRKRR